MTAILSEMQDHGAWKQQLRLQEFLGSQLAKGRLALVLGAGVSSGFHLPGWTELIKRAGARVGFNPPTSVTLEIAAEELWRTGCNRDDLIFARHIKSALYDGLDLSMNALRKNELLSAIGAMMMSSSRGSVKNVITFNFDDLLETFLRYYGFSIDTIHRVPSWDSRADATIFHCHGLLPHEATYEEICDPIVMTQRDFDRVVGKDANIWRQTILQICRTHTCLFIGLSGEDKNLLSVLADVCTSHPAKNRNEPFWGVRLGLNEDPLTGTWEERGVCHVSLANHEEIPSWLFNVCQIASKTWHSQQD